MTLSINVGINIKKQDKEYESGRKLCPTTLFKV